MSRSTEETPDPRDALAQRLHEWRATQKLGGCGWQYASVVHDEPLCPCPADATAIAADLVVLSSAQAAEQDAPEPLTAYTHTRYEHLTTCKKYGVGMGGGSRAGYPCTCGLDAALSAAPPAAPTSEQDRLAMERFIEAMPKSSRGEWSLILSGWPEGRSIQGGGLYGRGSTLPAAVDAALADRGQEEPR